MLYHALSEGSCFPKNRAKGSSNFNRLPLNVRSFRQCPDILVTGPWFDLADPTDAVTELNQQWLDAIDGSTCLGFSDFWNAPARDWS